MARRACGLQCLNIAQALGVSNAHHFLIEMLPNEPLSSLRNTGTIRFVVGNPTQEQRGMLNVRIGPDLAITKGICTTRHGDEAIVDQAGSVGLGEIPGSGVICNYHWFAIGHGLRDAVAETLGSMQRNERVAR